MGDRFYAAVLTSLQLLLAFPSIGPVVHQEKVRRVLVFNRNYGLFYVVESRGVILHALLDLRADPRSIAKRLDSI